MARSPNTQHAVSPLVKALLIGVLGVVLFIECWSGARVHALSEEKRGHKMAYAFVNNVSFGMLSVDVWRNQVVQTARQEIGSFRLTPEQEAGLRRDIEAQLHKLVDDAFTEINKPKKSIGDKLKKAAINTMVDQKEVDAEIPGFSKRIMGVITKPSSYKRITKIADTTVSRISRKIYDSSVAATSGMMDSIYRSYGATDKPTFEAKNRLAIAALREDINRSMYIMMGSAVFMILLWIVLRRRTSLRAIVYVFSAVGVLALLLVGVSTTIIDIDASLAKMDIQFLSGSLSFRNQSLFFQSQSIIDVIGLLIGSGVVASVIVGFMIAIFCILFPVVILLATCMVAIYPRRWNRNGNMEYFAFQASKWNMADVMMVAILMTYIGFNGIVDSTLTSLNYTEGSITSVTSNDTSIEPGYIIFIAFVVCSSVLMGVFRRVRKKETAETAAA